MVLQKRNTLVSPTSVSYTHLDVYKRQHKSTLACAVLSDQTQYFTGFQCEIDVRQDLVAEEIFFDIPHLQQRSVIIRHRYAPRKTIGGECSPPIVL